RTGGQSLDPAERGVDLLSRRIDLVEEVRAENRRRLDRGLDSRVLVLLAHRFSFVRLAELAPSSAASAELSSPRRYPATPTVFTLVARAAARCRPIIPDRIDLHQIRPPDLDPAAGPLHGVHRTA